MKRKRVICAGNGLASLNFALHIDAGTEVFILALNDFSISNSFMAKGGIAIPSGDRDIELHIRDTLMAGDGLCDYSVVEDIISAGPELLRSMRKDGFVFDETISREGGHSRYRIRHVGDETGKHLTRYYFELVKQRPNIHILYHTQLLDLWVEDGICLGGLVGETTTNSVKWMSADAVVMATGGAANLFRNNTNCISANGEGYAIAHRAGAQLRGMEFIQFHPTKLFRNHEQGSGFLVTEAFRGSGAVLRGLAGEDLMSSVHPLASLAPRDIVSRSIYKYMKLNRTDFVSLDFNSISRATIKKDFPSLDRISTQYDFFLSGTMPVTPAAHYTCGGIVTNTSGATDIHHFYAIGEVASTGLHGANRLASNSLLELMVVSERAAMAVNMLKPGLSDHVIHSEPAGISHFNSLINEVHSQIQSIMWDHFGIVRKEEEMNEGLNQLNRMREELSSLLSDGLVHIGLKQTMNKLEAGLLIAGEAIQRKENRGCHYLEGSYYKSMEIVEALGNNT